MVSIRFEEIRDVVIETKKIQTMVTGSIWNLNDEAQTRCD